MKALFLLILLIPSILCAKETPHDVMVFAATPCYEKCPVYDFMLFSDGTFIFNGKDHVAYKGLYKFSLDKKIFGKAVKLTEKYQFQKFGDMYGWTNEQVCKKVMSDNPGKIISLRLDGGNKTVKHYHGCSGFEREKELLELEVKIIELLDLAKYISDKPKTK